MVWGRTLQGLIAGADLSPLLHTELAVKAGRRQGFQDSNRSRSDLFTTLSASVAADKLFLLCSINKPMNYTACLPPRCVGGGLDRKGHCRHFSLVRRYNKVCSRVYDVEQRQETLVQCSGGQ